VDTSIFDIQSSFSHISGPGGCLAPVAGSIFRPLSQTHICKREFTNGRISRFCFVFQVIQVISSGEFHGVVVPLCGTSWDKLDWDRFHRGHRACPATRTGLQRGYMTCPWDKDRSLLTFPSPSGTGLVQAACLSHWDKHSLSQSACPTGTGCVCPSVLSQWDRFGTGTTLSESALDQV